MTLRPLFLSALLCAGLAFGPAPLAAQDGDATAFSPDALSLGEPADEAEFGMPYVAGEFVDWQMRCIRTPDGDDPCQLYQLLRDDEGNSVAEISVFGLPAGQAAAAGATIITPLETLLTAQLTMVIDNGTPRRYPFTWCAAIGCVARIGLTGEEITAMQRGVRARVTIVPVAAPDQPVSLNVSLRGFTAGLAAVNAANGL
jgi:invasion protein IalB